MSTLDRPRLRSLRTRIVRQDGEDFVALEDPSGAAPGPVLVPLEGYRSVVRHFDGRTSLEEIQHRLHRERGAAFSPEELEALVDRLDAAMVLDGPTFAAFDASYRAETVRPAALAGVCYPASAPALRAALARHFDHPDGAGTPRRRPGGPPLRGVLSPHIDFHRGGPTYTWAYRALAERSAAEVFVILGVAHQPTRRRFTLTRKDFDTPLGTAAADRVYVDRLLERAGDHLLDDELAHRTEHSVEFQAVFLRHLLGDRRPFAIVPILVGSFHDLMVAGVDPIDDPEVARFVAALRAAEAACGKPVAYIGGVDLSHVGPEFGDPRRLDAATLERVRSFDQAMLGHAAGGDARHWFAEAAAVGNRYRVCGLAATYTMLQAIGPVRGQLLRYEQAVDPGRNCGVTFASVAFEPL